MNFQLVPDLTDLMDLRTSSSDFIDSSSDLTDFIDVMDLRTSSSDFTDPSSDFTDLTDVTDFMDYFVYSRTLHSSSTPLSPPPSRYKTTAHLCADQP
jgi:hypothetical protein